MGAHSNPAPLRGRVAAGDPRLNSEYVARLEQQIQRLNGQLHEATLHNRALEQEHLQLAHYRAESDRHRDEQATALLAEAQAEAQRVRASAAAEARRMLDQVAAEVDQIQETIAERLASSVPPSAPAHEADPEDGASVSAEVDDQAAATDPAIRGQIDDLLRLREMVTASLKATVAGLQRQLSELEGSPLLEADENVAMGAHLHGVPAPAPPVEVHVSPVTSILQATELERVLGETDPNTEIVLRSVADGAALLDAYGISAERLVDAAATLLPGASLEPSSDARVTVVLPEAAA